MNASSKGFTSARTYVLSNRTDFLDSYNVCKFLLLLFSFVFLLIIIGHLLVEIKPNSKVNIKMYAYEYFISLHYFYWIFYMMYRLLFDAAMRLYCAVKLKLNFI